MKANISHTSEKQTRSNFRDFFTEQDYWVWLTATLMSSKYKYAVHFLRLADKAWCFPAVQEDSQTRGQEQLLLNEPAETRWLQWLVRFIWAISLNLIRVILLNPFFGCVRLNEVVVYVVPTEKTAHITKKEKITNPTKHLMLFAKENSMSPLTETSIFPVIPSLCQLPRCCLSNFLVFSLSSSAVHNKSVVLKCFVVIQCFTYQ